MTDTGPPTNPGDVVITGQRRRTSSEPFPERPPHVESPFGDTQVRDPLDGSEPDPCADPATALDWNADAAGASTTKDLQQFARSVNPDEQDFNEREYGAALWERADGSVVRGRMTAGQHTFYEAAQLAAQGLPARAGVEIDWTQPFSDAVLIATVHTHPTGGTILSGSSRLNDDQAVLSYTQTQREAQRPGRGLEARLYVAANQFGSYEQAGEPKITVYDETNRDAAISGVEGAEVNPEGQPCS